MHNDPCLEGPASRTSRLPASHIARWLFAAGLAFGGVPLAAQAQTVGGVFGPTVNAGELEVEYRLGVELGEDGDDTEYAHRFHAQFAFNDSLRFRAITDFGSGDTGNADLEFRYVQGELQWQYEESGEDGYAAGFRFDYRLNEGDDRADQFGVNWTHQWALSNDWRMRAILLFDVDVGERARDGLFVETRASVSRRLTNGLRIGVDSLNKYGGTDSGFGGFQDQSHQIGPLVTGSIGDVGWYFGPLFGLSDGAPETDIRFRLTRDF